MKNKKLKSESYGTQQQTWAGGAGAGSNFQHGKDLGTHTRGSLGTRGGDSNFSRRTQRTMPIDYFDARHAAESDKDCDGEDWATGYCPDEVLDEDYVVENSRYKLSNLSLLSEQRIGLLDAEPDENESNRAVDLMLADPAELARTERTAAEIGLELGADGISSLVNLIPGPLSDAFIIAKIISNIRSLSNSSDLILDLDEKFKKEIEVLTNQEMISDRRKYINIFSSGIKEIEKIQADMYIDIGDLVKALIELLPANYIAGVAASFLPTGPLGAVVVDAVAKTVEILAAGAAGSATQLLIQKFVENLEQDTLENDDFTDTDVEFERWLKRDTDPNSKALKLIIFMLRVGEGPFSGLAKHFFIHTQILRIFRSLFVGAKMQNILIQKIRNLQDQNFVDTHTREYEEASTEKPEGEEYSETSVSPEEELGSTSSTEPQGSEFFRKLFFKDPSDKGMFSESLDSQSLHYLIEDIDSELDEDIDSELDEEDINEFSGAGGAGGVSLPLGMSTKGPKGNTSANSGGAAWPYSKKQQTAFKKYSKKSFGGK